MTAGTPGKGFQLTRRVEAALHKDDRKFGEGGSFVAGSLRSIKRLLSATFLPSGYPKTVGENYSQYCIWQGVSNFAITANSVLASTFLLYSVGLGAGAIATAGALNWVLKDGLGQMGTLVFGKIIAHNFDIHSKSWYFLSMLMLKWATGVEILTFLFPHYFLFMGSIANTLKGLAWMASGSTRSVFNLSFARDNNIADITAKGTSQFILASLFGTAAGASMCTYVGQDLVTALLCSTALTIVTLFSTYKTVKTIPLPTLNSTRLQLLSEQFLASVRVPASERRELASDRCYIDPNTEYDRVYDESIRPQISNPVALAAADPPLPFLMGDQRILNPAIIVGTSLIKLVEGHPQLMVLLLTTFKYSHYILLPVGSAIHVVLHQAADGRDICQAYLQACILRRRLREGEVLHPSQLAEMRIALQDTLLTSERLTTPFMAALGECGWRLEKVSVEANKSRARW